MKKHYIYFIIFIKMDNDLFYSNILDILTNFNEDYKLRFEEYLYKYCTKNDYPLNYRTGLTIDEINDLNPNYTFDISSFNNFSTPVFGGGLTNDDITKILNIEILNMEKTSAEFIPDNPKINDDKYLISYNISDVSHNISILFDVEFILNTSSFIETINSFKIINKTNQEDIKNQYDIVKTINPSTLKLNKDKNKFSKDIIKDYSAKSITLYLYCLIVVILLKIYYGVYILWCKTNTLNTSQQLLFIDNKDVIIQNLFEYYDKIIKICNEIFDITIPNVDDSITINELSKEFMNNHMLINNTSRGDCWLNTITCIFNKDNNIIKELLKLFDDSLLNKPLTFELYKILLKFKQLLFKEYTLIILKLCKLGLNGSKKIGDIDKLILTNYSGLLNIIIDENDYDKLMYNFCAFNTDRKSEAKGSGHASYMDYNKNDNIMDLYDLNSLDGHVRVNCIKKTENYNDDIYIKNENDINILYNEIHKISRGMRKCEYIKYHYEYKNIQLFICDATKIKLPHIKPKFKFYNDYEFKYSMNNIEYIMNYNINNEFILVHDEKTNNNNVFNIGMFTIKNNKDNNITEIPCNLDYSEIFDNHNLIIEIISHISYLPIIDLSGEIFPPFDVHAGLFLHTMLNKRSSNSSIILIENKTSYVLLSSVPMNIELKKFEYSDKSLFNLYSPIILFERAIELKVLNFNSKLRRSCKYSEITDDCPNYLEYDGKLINLSGVFSHHYARYDTTTDDFTCSEDKYLCKFICNACPIIYYKSDIENKGKILDNIRKYIREIKEIKYSIYDFFNEILLFGKNTYGFYNVICDHDKEKACEMKNETEIKICKCIIDNSDLFYNYFKKLFDINEYKKMAYEQDKSNENYITPKMLEIIYDCLLNKYVPIVNNKNQNNFIDIFIDKNNEKYKDKNYRHYFIYEERITGNGITNNNRAYNVYHINDFKVFSVYHYYSLVFSSRHYDYANCVVVRTSNSLALRLLPDHKTDVITFNKINNNGNMIYNHNYNERDTIKCDYSFYPIYRDANNTNEAKGFTAVRAATMFHLIAMSNSNIYTIKEINIVNTNNKIFYGNNKFILDYAYSNQDLRRTNEIRVNGGHININLNLCSCLLIILIIVLIVLIIIKYKFKSKYLNNY